MVCRTHSTLVNSRERSRPTSGERASADGAETVSTLRNRSHVVPATSCRSGAAPIWLSSSTNGPNGSSPPLTGVQ